jgi:hypothetical protein
MLYGWGIEREEEGIDNMYYDIYYNRWIRYKQISKIKLI